MFVLNDISGACLCTCKLVDLLLPEMCFWLANFRKNMRFLRCIHVLDMVLKYRIDINERNWIQLCDGSLPALNCLHY